MKPLLAAALLLLATLADAAVVRLKNGSALSGVIVSATARDVTIQTGGETRVIDTADIARIDYAETDAAPPPRLRPTPPPLWHELSLTLALAVPLDRVDFSDMGGGRVRNGGEGARLGFEYLVPVDRRLSLGPSFDWVVRGHDSSLSGVPSADTDVRGDSLIFMGWAKYALRPEQDVRPYAKAGLGAHRTTTIVDAVPNAGFVWADTQTSETRRLSDDDAWGLALGAAFGVDFAYNESGFLGLELAWLGLQGESHRPTPTGQTQGYRGGKSTLSVLSVGARWGMRF